MNPSLIDLRGTSGVAFARTSRFPSGTRLTAAVLLVGVSALFGGLTRSEAQAPPDNNELAWVVDATGSYEDPTNWEVEDGDGTRTDTTPLPTDSLTFSSSATCIFDSSETNVSLGVSPYGGTVNLQLNGNTWTFTGGPDTVLFDTSGTVSVGNGTLDASAGIFEVRSGAALTTASGTTIKGQNVYFSEVATGDIAGGAKLTSAGQIYVGEDSLTIANQPLAPTQIASLTVESGGTVTSANELTVGGVQNGNLTIKTGGIVTNTIGFLGVGASSFGIATVQGSWTNSSFFYVGEAGNGTVSVNGGGRLTTQDAFIASDSGAVGLVDVGNNGQWTVNGSLYVGQGGNGTLTVEGGGQVNVSGSTLSLGYSAGSTGTLNIIGSSSQVNFTGGGSVEIGRDGYGTFSLQQGATAPLPATVLGALSDGEGKIVVTGAGSTLTVNGQLTVGGASGGFSTTTPGPLGGSTTTVTPGGAVLISGGGIINSTGNLEVARDSGSTGTVTIDGMGSQWNLTGATNDVVGDGGPGSLTVSGGATFSDSNLTIAKQASSGTTASPSMVTLTGTASGTQTALTVNGKLEIGEGAHATLSASAGATLTTTGNTDIGDTSSGVGIVTLSDAKTLWTANADINVAVNGTGTLNVQGGASVTAPTLSIVEGVGTGTVTVTGVGSSLMTSVLNVGGSADSTKATLNVNTGAQVTTSALFLQGTSVNLTVDGSDTQTMTASKLTADTLAVLPQTGTTLLTVSNGANLTVNSGDIKLTSDTNTQLIVKDAGSRFNAPASALVVGNGSGSQVSVNVANGGKMVTGGATISGSNASVTLTGGSGAANSLWTLLKSGSLNGNLALNNGGTLTINNGGGVSVAGQTNVSSGSTVAVAGSAAGGADFTSAGLAIFGTFTLGPDSQATSTAATDIGDAVEVAQGGQIKLTDSSATLGGANMTIGSGSAVTAQSGVISINNRVTVGSGGTLDVSGGGSLNAGLVLNKAAASQISVGLGGSLKNFGSVVALTVNIQAGGTVGGSGSFHAAVINGGKVAPGDPQTLTISGSYTQQNGGVLDLAIAGTDPALMDHLDVSGEVSLESGSVLELDCIDGFAPKAGQTFDFLAFGSLDPLNSTFSSVEITGLAAGFEYSVIPDPTDPSGYELLALNDGIATTVPEPNAWIACAVAGALLARMKRLGRRSE